MAFKNYEDVSNLDSYVVCIAILFKWENAFKKYLRT